MDPLYPLDRQHLDLWILPSEDPQLSERMPQLVEMLSRRERLRCEKIVFERIRSQYVLTRALVRRSLSLYANVSPETWRFNEDKYGRPYIEAPKSDASLDFNISHSAGMIVCLIGRERRFGVDVEVIGGRCRMLDIAERFFSRCEAAELKALQPPLQAERFCDYWTLKEAYIKARGRGLSIPLHQFSFRIDAQNEVKISFDPALKDDPECWSFYRRRVSERYKLAVALRHDALGDTPPKIVVRDALPLLLS